MRVNGGAATPIGSGPHGTQLGDVVVVTAVPDSGYTLVGTASPWSHTFGDPGDCLDGVTAAGVDFQDGVCNADTTGTTGGSYTITAASHISYTVSLNGGAPEAILPGQYSAQPGDVVVITAIPAAGYKLVNTASPWSHTFGDPGDCLDKASAGDPHFVDGICNAASTGSTVGSYEILPADHITYTVRINGGAAASILPGKYDAQPEDLVVITAIPDAGYKLDGTNSPWTWVFADPGACLDTAMPVEPSVTAQTCTVDDLDGAGTLRSGFITIPATTGVIYSIDGTVITAPGNIDEIPGDHVVTAVAALGYVLDKSYDGPWTEHVGTAELCGDLVTHPTVVPVVESTLLQCAADGSYTLSNNLEVADAVIWTVNGAPVAQGKYQVSAPGTVTIHAAANGPDFGFTDGTQKDWTLTFSEPASCGDLKTLALTGSAPVGGMVLGYFLLIAGLGLVAIRMARRRNPQEPQE